jgi:pimeloyl-ACP methyl ester carboxylesterase
VIERSVDVADQKIAFVESAGTGRPVVLLHGNSSSSRVWHPLLAGPFGQRFRCLALDLPGHGRSAKALPETYSVPGYAAILTGFLTALAAQDAVIVGWSLGGHIALEAAPALPEAAGFVIFGTPPVGTAAQLGEAFLPNPTLNVGYTAEVDAETALSYATSFLAPGSTTPPDEFVADILATDGVARAELLASIGAGRFADEVAVIARLTQPIAVLHGEHDQLVSLDYLRGLAIPTLWRGAVQLLPGVGHAPHVEAPQQFADITTRFITDLPTPA